MNNDKMKELLNKVQEIQLENGFKILYYENKDFKNYYMEYTTKYGGLDYTYLKDGKEIKHPTGIAHFLEHVMFNMPYGDGLVEFDKYLGSANAYTSYDKTSYLVKCSTNALDNLKTLLDLVSEIYIDEKKVEKEKGIIVEEANMYDKDPEWLIFKNTLKNSLGSIKYKSDILGSLDDIKSMTVETLKEAYSDFYTPNNQFIVIIGEDVKELVDYTHKYMENKKNIISNIKKIKNKENLEGEDKQTEDEIFVTQSYLSINYKYVFEDEIDTFKNSLYLDLILELLYTSFNKNYIKAQENYDIDYTFEYDNLLYSNTLLIMFFGVNQDISKLEKFLNSNSIQNINEDIIKALINQKIGRLFRRFNEEVSIGRFLNHLYTKNETLESYYEYLLSFNICYVEDLLNTNLKQTKVIYEIKGNENERN